MNPREVIRAHAYPVLAVVSTFSLVIIAISLVPVAKWTRSQNECINKTYRIGGINYAGLPTKVWSCNGGGS